MRSMADDVEALIRELGLESSRTILVGHSMGGMVACDVASRVKLMGIALLGPVHPTSAMVDVFTQRIENVIKSKYYPAMASVLKPANRLSDGIEALADTIPNAATGSSATQVHRSLVRTLVMSQDPQGYASLCKVIADAEAPEYTSVTCPVLIIAGGEDKTAPLQSSELILKR